MRSFLTGLRDRSQPYTDKLKPSPASSSSQLSALPRAGYTGWPPCRPDCVLRQLGVSIASAQLQDPRQANNPEIPSEISEQGRLKSRELYKQLRPWQTRLIELIPGRLDIHGVSALPSCRLLTVEFIDMEGVGLPGTDEVVTYSALSYVWGQTALDSQILCNGIWLPICKSLAYALYHLSRSGRQRYLWCDAICIDQQNVAERALQVKNMLRIFEKAETIVAWLGDVKEEDLLPLAFIKREMSQKVSAFARLQTDSVDHGIYCGTSLRALQSVLRDLTWRAFFARMWIRQEVFAATVLTLQFTDFKMNFDFRSQIFWEWMFMDSDKLTRGTGMDLTAELTDPLNYVTSHINRLFQLMGTHFQHNGTSASGYKAPSNKTRRSLFWLRTMQDGCQFQVSDPRDRVYAVLGILQSQTTRLYVADGNERIKVPFPIDYSKTVSEVYQDFMKYLINLDGNLDCLCVFQKPRKTQSGLPSWALDWTYNTARKFVDIPIDNLPTGVVPSKAEWQDSSNVNQLSLLGYHFCSIRKIVHRVIVPGSYSCVWVTPTSVDWIGISPDQIYAILDEMGHAQANNENYVDAAQLERSSGIFVPRHTILDDELIIAQGSMFPLILRRLDGGEYLYVGPAIVLGDHAPMRSTRTPSADSLKRYVLV